MQVLTPANEMPSVARRRAARRSAAPVIAGLAMLLAGALAGCGTAPPTPSAAMPPLAAPDAGAQDGPASPSPSCTAWLAAQQGG